VHDETVARSILATLAIPASAISAVGTGFASDAWLVHAEGDVGPSVLRIASGAVSPATTYRMEHALMARLRVAGAAVPAPIAGDWDIAGWDGPAFSLTSFVAGAPLRPESRDRAAPAIATFLRTLHAVDVTGFGPLVVVGGSLRGVADALEAGLLRWAERPLWPLGGARLAVHPALRDRDDLATLLGAHAGVVRAALLDGPTAIIHTDLHEENTLDDGGRVSIIDLGEAFVGPVAWEFASIAYFGGWPFADRVLEAYLAGTGGTDGAWHREVAAAALCFGVFRWQQDRTMALDQDAHNEGFLETTLERLSRAG
jgi:aminoglycoside phosphotransferase (APT) family kinase protein